MDIRQIEYFRTLCETKNFTRAADRLHISQPSLSAAIQKLEEEFQVRLFARDNKKVMLTREGAVLLKESDLLVRQMNHVKEVMRDLREAEERTLKLAFPATVGAWLWPVLIEDFHSRYPEIELIVEDKSTREILEGISDDELEIGYGVVNINDNPEIVSRPLVKDELKLLLNVEDDLRKRERVDIHSLEQRTVIMYRRGTSFSEQLFLTELKNNNVYVKLRYVREQATVFNMVAQGLGIAIILDETELIKNNSSLCVREFQEPILYESGFFWRKERYLSSSVRKLIDFFDSRKNRTLL